MYSNKYSKKVRNICLFTVFVLLVSLFTGFGSIIQAASADFIIENGVLTKYTGAGGVVTIPENAYKIAPDTFAGNTAITGVVFHNAVLELGARAFKNCTGLQNIIIPPYVTVLPTEVFCGCTNLSSVVLHDYVESIGASAFQGCTSLSSITFPYGLMAIGISAFEDCTHLSSVTISSKTAMIGDFAFGKNNYLIAIRGVSNTRAETFAQKFGNPFTPITEPNPLPQPSSRPPLPKIELSTKPSMQDVSTFPNGVCPSNWAVASVLYLVKTYFPLDIIRNNLC